MKICWDNLERLKFSRRTGRWYEKTRTYHYREQCETCKEPFLSQNKEGRWCSNGCHTSSEHHRKWGSINGKKLKGHKRSDEYKRKMSEAKKGQNTGIRNPMYGKHHTEESKRKMSENRHGINQGIKRPEHSIKMSGEGNPNWQGGLSYEPYCPLWKDKEYKDYIKERDSNKCSNPDCNGKSTRLCIHHINYDKKDCRPGNLITVCRSCNARANFNRGMWEMLYVEVINKMKT